MRLICAETALFSGIGRRAAASGVILLRTMVDSEMPTIAELRSGGPSVGVACSPTARFAALHCKLETLASQDRNHCWWPLTRRVLPSLLGQLIEIRLAWSFIASQGIRHDNDHPLTSNDRSLGIVTT